MMQQTSSCMYTSGIELSLIMHAWATGAEM